MMKKVWLIVLPIILLIGSVLFIMMFDWNRFGKTNVYVVVGEPSKIVEDRLETGEIMERYAYETVSYDENGEELLVEYDAHKELRKEAFLKLYLDRNDQVTSYDEVTWDELPAAVQEQLEEK
ncbi:MAG TPA: YxeA family protein [Pseudogracilibacillus sp.]|nr:YxeA family protein [Pseudogracilibacillus sp.]